MHKFRAVAFWLSSGLFALLAILVPPAIGQTWTGNVSGLWNNAGNWSGGIPANSNNTQLTFGATSNPTMTDDIPGTLMLNRLTFNAGSPTYSLSGNSLDFRITSGNVQPTIVSNSSNTVTINDPIAFSTSAQITLSGPGNTTLNGAITGSASINVDAASGIAGLYSRRTRVAT